MIPSLLRVSARNVPVCRFKAPRVCRHHAHMLSGHTGGFQRVHHKPHRSDTTTTPLGDRDRERQNKKTETERREDGRGDTREKIKEKQKICLLNRVRYDCSLISFSASWPVNIFFFLQKKFCGLGGLCSYSLHFF